MNIKPSLFIAILLAGLAQPVSAQRVLSLDSCRMLALRGNKSLAIARVNRERTAEQRQAARTQYLPKVDGVAAYSLTSKEISLLSDKQKDALNHLGDNTGAALQQALTKQVGEDVAKQIGQTVSAPLNAVGQDIRKGFRSNNRNMFGGDILVRQPVYMGGAIKAANSMADISEQTADDNISLSRQNTVFDVDQAYWQVVSLRQKQILSDQYLNLVRKFHDDVNRMLEQGVATKANELRVAVRVNEAEMNRVRVDDGLVLARMHLCQLCGLDLNSDITLTDENDVSVSSLPATDSVWDEARLRNNRPELRLLQDAVNMSEANTRLVRSAFLPHVSAIGGWMFSTPNVYNSFNHDLSGMFHVGISVQVPIWNWGEGRHKVRAAKAASVMAKWELADMTEKVDLQANQAKFRMKEAWHKLTMARSNMRSAEENLRCANVGFKEGVIQTTDVMEAQTAWQSARSDEIDALIEVRLADVNLRKALGTLDATLPDYQQHSVLQYY